MADFDSFESRFHKVMAQQSNLNLLRLIQSLPINIEAYTLLEELLLTLQSQYQHPQMYSVLAFVYEHQGKFEQSIEAAKFAMQQFDNPLIRMLLVNNYRVLNQHAQADQVLVQSYEKFSSDGPISQARIQLAIERQEFQLAYQITRRIYERNPNDPNLAYQFARFALGQKDYEQAKLVFESLLVYPSLENEMNYSLGLIANEEERFELALRYFSKVKPSNYYQNSQYFRAKIIWDATGDVKEVGGVFDQLASNVGEEHRLAVVLLEADFWTSSQMYQIGLERIEQYAQMYGDEVDFRYQYALALDSTGNIDQSLDILKQLLDQFPENADFLNAYGYVLGNRTQEVERALTYVGKSLEIDPSNSAALDSFGWLLYKLQRFEEALPYLQQAFEQYPHDEVAAHLGAVLWQLKDYEQAELIWEEGFKIHPQSIFIKDIKHKLKNNS